MIERIIHQTRFIHLILFFIAFILYANTIPNDYALDDSIVITQNIYVQKGIAGIGDIFGKETFSGFFKQKKDLVQGGRYRPLSLATFAIEQSIWNGNPHISHLINAILYGLLCIVIYKCLKRILEFLNRSEIAIPVSFLTTLLFAVHPIHSEVVANIKGRDELLSLLFCMLAIYYFIKYLQTNQILQVVGSGFLLFLGLLSKENAITMPLLAGIIILLNFNKRLLNKYLISFFFLTIACLFYYYIRSSVMGNHSGKLPDELMNNPFLHASQSQKIATIFYTLLLYIKLLIFPHPLTFDYYPYHIQLQEWSNPLILISVFIYTALTVFSLYFLLKGKYKIQVLAILFYLITLLPLSNLFINTGSFMNERFVFFGSLGFCIIVAYGLYNLFQKWNEKPGLRVLSTIVLFVIIIPFSLKTIARNQNWKDNYTLFLHDVNISAGSAKSNVTAGGILLEKSTAENDTLKRKVLLDQSITYLETALSIYPNYVDALLLIGNASFNRDKDFSKADFYYSRIFNLAPAYNLAYSNYKIILASVKDPQVRKAGYMKILTYQPKDFEANSELGSLYGKELKQLDSAIVYLEKAVLIKPKNKDANRDLGVAYGMMGQIEKSLKYFEKTIEIDPDDPANYINLGVSYQNMGMIDKANQQFMKARELQNLKQ